MKKELLSSDTETNASAVLERLKALIETCENAEDPAVRDFAKKLISEATKFENTQDKKVQSPLLGYMMAPDGTSDFATCEPRLIKDALAKAGQNWLCPFEDTDFVRLIQLRFPDVAPLNSSYQITVPPISLLCEMIEGFFSVLAVMEETYASEKILFFLVLDVPSFQRQLQNCQTAMEADLMTKVQLLASPCGKGIAPIPQLYQSLSSMHRILDQAPHREMAAATFESLLPDLLLSALPSELMDHLRSTFRSYLSSTAEDDDLKRTAGQFLQCNLNITDTAKAMFLHRNTLVYRLEKIQRDTGFDLRQFNDSWIFRLLLSHLIQRSSL